MKNSPYLQMDNTLVPASMTKTLTEGEAALLDLATEVIHRITLLRFALLDVEAYGAWYKERTKSEYSFFDFPVVMYVADPYPNGDFQVYTMTKGMTAVVPSRFLTLLK